MTRPSPETGAIVFFRKLDMWEIALGHLSWACDGGPPGFWVEHQAPHDGHSDSVLKVFKTFAFRFKVSEFIVVGNIRAYDVL